MRSEAEKECEAEAEWEEEEEAGKEEEAAVAEDEAPEQEERIEPETEKEDEREDEAEAEEENEAEREEERAPEEEEEPVADVQAPIESPFNQHRQKQQTAGATNQEHNGVPFSLSTCAISCYEQLALSKTSERKDAARETVGVWESAEE